MDYDFEKEEQIVSCELDQSFDSSDDSNECPLEVGKIFTSFENLKDTIKCFEDSTYTQFSVRTSKKLDRWDISYRNVNPELKVDHCYWHCLQGGKKFKSRSKGTRKNTKTILTDCPSFIRVGLSQDKQYLVVTKTNFAHNHKISKELYDSLPRQRILTEQQKHEVAELVLDLNVDKRLVYQKLRRETDKCIKMKDIHNIVNLYKTKCAQPPRTGKKNEKSKTNVSGNISTLPSEGSSPCHSPATCPLRNESFNESLTSSGNTLSAEYDELDQYGYQVINSLRTMSKDQQEVARHWINAILTKGHQNSLDPDDPILM